MLVRAVGHVADVTKLIRALIILAHVVCANEIPTRIGLASSSMGGIRPMTPVPA